MLGLKTLVLDPSYQPISLFPLHTIPAEDAVTRIFSGTCDVVAEYDMYIKTPTLKMKWPSVIARKSGEISESVRNVSLNKDSLFYRDHGVCQYCLTSLTIGSVTVDHVHPVSKGGVTAWNNVVAACPICNTDKGNQLPVGQWAPKRKPWEPTYWDLLKARRKFPIIVYDKSWVDFIGDWDNNIIVKQPAA